MGFKYGRVGFLGGEECILRMRTFVSGGIWDLGGQKAGKWHKSLCREAPRSLKPLTQTKGCIFIPRDIYKGCDVHEENLPD